MQIQMLISHSQKITNISKIKTIQKINFPLLISIKKKEIRIKIKSNNFSHYHRIRLSLEMMIVKHSVYRLEIMDAGLVKNKKFRSSSN